MTFAECTQGKRVMYIPLHAHGNNNHKDVESGVVVRHNYEYVFVKFDGDRHPKSVIPQLLKEL
jgi:hypothetical protein